MLSTEEFLVRDDCGIQMFNRENNFIKEFAADALDHCYGLAEDEEGNIITINHAPLNTKKSTETLKGRTDVFFINKNTEKVVKKIEMEEITESVLEDCSLPGVESSLKFLYYKNRVLYVVDMGLDCKCFCFEF